MRLTKEQIKELEPYERHFTTAVRSQFVRYPGMAALTKMHEIYKGIVPNAPRLNAGCATCAYNLVRDLGNIYFADKEEMEKPVVVEESKPKAKPKKKATKKK